MIRNGCVGERQLRWLAEQLESYRRNEWLRMGAVTTTWCAAPNCDDLGEANDLRRILGTHRNSANRRPRARRPGENCRPWTGASAAAKPRP